MANCRILCSFGHDMGKKKNVQFKKNKIRIVTGAALEFAKSRNLVEILSDEDIIDVMKGEEGLANKPVIPTVDPKIATAVVAAAPIATYTDANAPVVEGADQPDLV